MDTELELKHFFQFVWHKKNILLLLVSFFIVLGLMRAFFIPKTELAKVTIAPASTRDISALNYERTPSSKVKMISPTEAFNLYRNLALSEDMQEEFTQTHRLDKKQLKITSGSRNTLLIMVTASTTEKARAVLTDFLAQTKQHTVKKINKLSNKAIHTIRTMTEKDIQRYKHLAKENLAQGQLAANVIDAKRHDVSLFPVALTVKDNQELASQYQTIAERYRLELATMQPLDIKPEDVELYNINYKIKVESQSPWPKRIKTVTGFFIIGSLLSMMILMLLFIYQSRVETGNSLR